MPQSSPMRPVDSPHKGPVTRKRFPFDDATIMLQELVLADMALKRVDVGAFCGICEISRLNLKHNQLTSPPQLCTLKCCLMDLHIGYNEISRLSKQYFRGFKNLKKINLTKKKFLCCWIYIGSNIQCHKWWRIRITFNHWVHCRHPESTLGWGKSLYMIMIFVIAMSLYCVTCLSWSSFT